MSSDDKPKSNSNAPVGSDQGHHLKSNEYPKLPPTMSERFKKLDIKDYLDRSPDAPEWFDPEHNRKLAQSGPDGILWAAPRDARYQQTKMGRQCFDYFNDYHRCMDLLGKDHEPCKFFRNTYRDICPSAWIAQFEEWVEAGVHPADFDR